MAKKRKAKSELTPEPVLQDPAGEPVKEEPVDEEPVNDPVDEDPLETVKESIEEPIKQEYLSEDERKPQILENAETAAIPDPSPAPAAPTAGGEVHPGNGTSDDDEEEEEEEEEESDSVSVQKLLEPLPKDQLAELLRDAAVKHPDVLDCVLRAADADPAYRKVFVHGLGWDTTAQALTEAFRPYGEIEDVNAVSDKATGKSKGYGFILFKHRSGAQRALEEPQKKIGNRMTACQLASAGPVPPPAPPVSEYTQRKIYVSNVGAELDPQKVLQFFSKYGEIEEGPLGLDKATGKPKGFCLFVYKTAESAKKALEEPHKNFEGHILHCQKAIDGPKPNKLGFQFQQGSAHHPGSAIAHGSHFPRNENAGIKGGVGIHVPAAAAAGNVMAPSPAGLGLNQAAQPVSAAAAGLSPALGQALTAFLATQGAGLGLTNLLGTLGSTGVGGPAVNQAVPTPMVNSGGHGMQGAYGNQVASIGGSMNAGMGGYGAPTAMQGGYGNAPMGQGSTRRHMGGFPPYKGR